MPPTSVNTPQPSFIPRDAKQSAGRSYEGAGFNELLLLLAIVVLVASVALAGGVFLYGRYLQSSNANKLAQLQRAEQEFQPSLVQQLQRLDDRMNATSQLLQTHLAPLALFTMLEQTTISTIQFTSLQFDATDMAHITLKMNGIADSVNAVALQSELFSKSGAIQSPIFSNLNREQDGIHFDFTATVNPASLNYAALVTGQSTTNQIPTASSTSAAGAGTGTAVGSSTPAGNPNPFNPTSQNTQGTTPASGTAGTAATNPASQPGAPSQTNPQQ